jgi:hypothetical protein
MAKDSEIIACIGWGSLIWDPRNLPCGEWHVNGPVLPIEFARVSENGRITLVVVNGAKPVRALWTILKVATISEAVAVLAERENVPDANQSIGRWPDTQRQFPGADVISAWAEAQGLSGVVWTALKCGMDRNSRGIMPTIEQLLSHISTLDEEGRERALEYVAKAPAQVQTGFRPQLLTALERDNDPLT